MYLVFWFDWLKVWYLIRLPIIFVFTRVETEGGSVWIKDVSLTCAQELSDMLRQNQPLFDLRSWTLTSNPFSLTWKMRTLKLFLLIRWAWLASSFFTWAPWRSILSRTCKNINLIYTTGDNVVKPMRFQHSSPPSWWQTVCGSCPAVCWQCWMCDCGSWIVWSYLPGYLWPRPPSPPDAPETWPTANQSDQPVSVDATSLNSLVWESY